MTAATAHRFQGSERDAVVLDLTDAAPQEGPSRLTGRDAELTLRLLNVGASRARGKLLLLVDLGFLGERHPLTSPARNLVDLAVEQGAVTVSAAALIAELWLGVGRGLGPSPAITWAASWENAIGDLLDRPLPQPTHVDVSVATDDQAGPWLDRTTTELLARGHPVTVRAPVTIARRFESTAVDLRLRTLGPAPIAFVGGTAMVVGGTDRAASAVCVSRGAFVAAARRLLLAE